MKLAFVLAGGLLFGFGLALSGMTKPEVVLSFLRLEDLGLLLVMAGALAVTSLAFRLGPRLLPRPPAGTFTPPLSPRLPRTVAGAALFGLGWGLCGLCPGAAVASLGIGNWPVLLGLAGMFAGAYAQGRLWPEHRSQEPPGAPPVHGEPRAATARQRA